MVGDRMHDIIGAKASGLASVAVLWGYGTHDEFSICEPDLLVSNPATLLEVLTHLTSIH